MTEELKFPMSFKCPVCGHKETILRTLIQKEQAEGIFPKEDLAGTGRFRVLLGETASIRSGAMAGKTMRSITYYKDICSKCGTEYIYLIQLDKETVPELPKGQRPIIFQAGLGGIPGYPGISRPGGTNRPRRTN